MNSQWIEESLKSIRNKRLSPNTTLSSFKITFSMKSKSICFKEADNHWFAEVIQQNEIAIESIVFRGFSIVVKISFLLNFNFEKWFSHQSIICRLIRRLFVPTSLADYRTDHRPHRHSMFTITQLWWDDDVSHRWESETNLVRRSNQRLPNRWIQRLISRLKSSEAEPIRPILDSHSSQPKTLTNTCDHWTLD